MATGTLTKWNTARGFGFIQPTPGNGENEIFIHISGFRQKGYQPCIGDQIRFKTIREAKTGKFRAVEAELVGGPKTPSAPRPMARSAMIPVRLAFSPWLGLVAALSLFCVGSAIFFWLRESSFIPLIGYVFGSFFAFGLYALDKYRAIKGAWRIPEKTLHLFEAIGGWPGAFIAQQTIRHKTAKLSYQVVYWIIVTIHLGLWGEYWLLPSSILQRYFVF